MSTVPSNKEGSVCSYGTFEELIIGGVSGEGERDGGLDIQGGRFKIGKQAGDDFLRELELASREHLAIFFENRIGEAQLKDPRGRSRDNCGRNTIRAQRRRNDDVRIENRPELRRHAVGPCGYGGSPDRSQTSGICRDLVS